MRRRITILLHWLSFLLLILLLAAGPVPVLGWLFVVSGLTMSALAITNGLMNGPGPKLEGLLRLAHPWLSRAMYVLLAGVAALTLIELVGATQPFDLRRVYFVTLSLASLHGVFHMWRHTALGDGALRRMAPRTLHNML